MYRDLGFIRVAGAARGAARGRTAAADGTAYAYLSTRTSRSSPTCRHGRLLSEYCVEFPDMSGAHLGRALPASDDVLAKWMALTADEDRVIRSANMHLPGRQVDPPGYAATSGGWRSGSGRGRAAASSSRPAHVSDETCAVEAGPSSRAPTAPRRAPT